MYELLFIPALMVVWGIGLYLFLRMVFPDEF